MAILVECQSVNWQNTTEKSPVKTSISKRKTHHPIWPITWDEPATDCHPRYFFRCLWVVSQCTRPGKQPHNELEKHNFLKMGKSTISTGPFSIANFVGRKKNVFQLLRCFTGWWFFATPLKKIEFVSWVIFLFPIYGEIKATFQTTNQCFKDAPNKQPTSLLWHPSRRPFRSSAFLGDSDLSTLHKAMLWKKIHL